MKLIYSHFAYRYRPIPRSRLACSRALLPRQILWAILCEARDEGNQPTVSHSRWLTSYLRSKNDLGACQSRCDLEMSLSPVQ